MGALDKCIVFKSALKRLRNTQIDLIYLTTTAARYTMIHRLCITLARVSINLKLIK